MSKLKSMAQHLRPLPKRRPSQITTQASAGSSQPSVDVAASSQPNSIALPNIKECAALAAHKPAPAVKVPKAEGSTPDVAACTPKTEGSDEQVTVDAAAAAASEPATQLESQKTSDSTVATSQATSSEERAGQDAVKQSADKPKRNSTEEYMSPFEQAQEPAAAPTQGQSPFANMS